jgi:hypothetical protein
MSYDNLNSEQRQYVVRANNFGGGADTTTKVVGPAGKRGRVLNVWVDHVTVTFVGTTTGGGVYVGKSGSTSAYFKSDLTTLKGSSPAVGIPVNLADTLTGDTEIPADTEVWITCVATVGGSVTGTADANVLIHWY